MRDRKQINTEALIQAAKTSEHKEAYKLLEKTQLFRVGVGVNVDSSDHSSFFIEITISLCSNSSEVDLQRLENILSVLRTLKTREYSMTYQDGNCISCEKNLTADNLLREYEAAKVLVTSIH